MLPISSAHIKFPPGLIIKLAHLRRARRRFLCRDTVKGKSCVGVGIGYDEVVAGHLGSGRVKAEAREAGAGGLDSITSPGISIVC